MKHTSPNNFYLVGFMGVGKSTVGKILAKKISFSFIDTDAWIEAKAAKTIGELFVEGESVFRKIESEVVHSVTQLSGQVIALGGGSLLDSENRKLISTSGLVIYLKASIPELIHRIQSSNSLRPLLTKVNSPEAKVAALLKDREPLYLAAPLQIETDGKTPEQVVEAILRGL